MSFNTTQQSNIDYYNNPGTNTASGSAADYSNAPATAVAPAAPATGAPPPAPFVPPPNVLTPPQASTSGLAAIPGNTPINGIQAQPTKGAPSSTIPASNFGQQAMVNGQPFTDNSQAFPNLMPLFANVPAGKGFGKGPSGQQNAAQPSMTGMPDTSGNPMDFHSQLQDFINSGLLGGSQRLQG